MYKKNNRKLIAKQSPPLLHSNNFIIFGQMPCSITKGHLKLLVKEVCHLHLKARDIDEHASGDVKDVVINIGDHIIPKVAKNRLKRLGRQILTEVVVEQPELLQNRFKLQLQRPMLMKYGIRPHNIQPLRVATEVVEWLHYELHLKYPQLEAIDTKYNNVVYTGLGQTITERVLKMMDSTKNISTRDAVKLYRKLHPFFADFELVTSHISSAEKQLKLPASDYTEADLLVPLPPPMEEAQERQLWEKHSKILYEKIQSYIASLDTETNAEDSAEMVERKRIRQTMKDFSNHVPQVLSYHSKRDMTDTPDWICVYFLGEPILPILESVRMFLREHGIEFYDTFKNPPVLNAVKVYIARSHYDKVMELDGCDPHFKYGSMTRTGQALSALVDARKRTDKLYIRHLNSNYMKNKYLLPSFKTINNWNNNLTRQRYVPRPKPDYANLGKLSNAFFI